MDISVVTPTLKRPHEVEGLLHNLSNQDCLPKEVILVDGAPQSEKATEYLVQSLAPALPFVCKYLRKTGGTAIQRNFGIDNAHGDFIAFIDDDVRLESDFFDTIVKVFLQEMSSPIGGVVGYRTNKHFTEKEAVRWQWYKRLRLLTTYEPGRYDFNCGYPINANLQPPFFGIREVDFMTTACAVWKRQVFEDGLRFDLFFRNYGVLEDAHLSLRAKRKWMLVQCGDAHCQELSSPNARENRTIVGYKYVVNYYYVFQDIAGPLTWLQRFRFWRYQIFELIRTTISMLSRRRRSDIQELLGRLQGFVAVAAGKAFKSPDAK